MGEHVLTAQGEQTCLDGQPFLVKGLRCSNALVSAAATSELVANLDTFRADGVNSISVFFMGSRFGDVQGYRRDATLDPLRAERMAQIIRAADAWAMVVLVGCLYWGNTRAKWPTWTQTEGNAAIRNTVQWLHVHDYRNVLIDVDNEGMARHEMGFDNRELVLAGKAVDASYVIGTNYHGDPPPEADVALHHSQRVPGKPYIESEGSPAIGLGAGGYWGAYSKQAGFYGYLNVGVYTDEMKRNQIALTQAHLARGEGYMLASTWLQAPPSQGPNHRPGGEGSAADPGIRWWLDFMRGMYGPYRR